MIKILILEDEANIRSNIIEILGYEGIEENEILACKNETEVFEHADELRNNAGQFIMLSDRDLGSLLTGPEVFRKLVTEYGLENKISRFVGMSAGTQMEKEVKELETELRKNGLNIEFAYMAKPFELPELLAAIEPKVDNGVR
jgi:CheY-like chemotaxis protein